MMTRLKTPFTREELGGRKVSLEMLKRERDFYVTSDGNYEAFAYLVGDTPDAIWQFYYRTKVLLTAMFSIHQGAIKKDPEAPYVRVHRISCRTGLFLDRDRMKKYAGDNLFTVDTPSGCISITFKTFAIPDMVAESRDLAFQEAAAAYLMRTLQEHTMHLSVDKSGISYAYINVPTISSGLMTISVFEPNHHEIMEAVQQVREDAQ